MIRDDNLRGGDDLFRDSSGAAIEHVFEGMRVEDAKGEEIGKVAIVKMGDANAATAGDDQDDNDGLFENFQEALGFHDEPDLPPSIRQRLLRTGYIKVEGSGLTGEDVYVSAENVAQVTGDTVRLSVLSEHLPTDT